MCFSAGASFTASAVLLTIGAISIKKSTSASQRLLSCIPLIFGVQQGAEGILWLGLSHPEYLYLGRPAKYAFLLFAQVIWPVMVPLSVMHMEADAKRKNLLKVLLGSGILLAGYLLYCLIRYRTDASINCYHINYQLSYPDITMKLGIFYFLPTIIPPFVSSIKRLRLLGITIFLSYIVTQIFYKEYLISVWCFFAAVISLIVLSIIFNINRKK